MQTGPANGRMAHYIILVSVLESHNKLLVLQEIHAPALSNDHDQRGLNTIEPEIVTGLSLNEPQTSCVLHSSHVGTISSVSTIWLHITTGQLTCKLSKIHIKRFKHALGTGTYRQLWMWLIFILPSPWSTDLYPQFRKLLLGWLFWFSFYQCNGCVVQ
jgi:hypothetical protein